MNYISDHIKIYFILGLGFVQSLIAQDTEITYSEFLKNAPLNVKEYYRVFDSLAHPTWKKWIHEAWSDDELKMYASLIYAADDYDPIAKRKYDLIRGKVSNDAKIGYVTKNKHVIEEIAKRFPQKYERLISKPYWLTIIAEDIETMPFTVMENPEARFTQKRIYGIITNVWKGASFKVGDSATSYYLTFWNYRGLEKGQSYIVALLPLREQSDPNIFAFALGGPDHVQQAVFPIEGEYIIDSDNVFRLGNKVKIKTFTNTLTSTINEIKSWKDGGR